MPGWRVGVLSKAALDQTNTRWAQGGVAAVLGGDEDSTDLHLADTLAAGAGLCDVDAVRVLVDEGPSRVGELVALGAVFDRQPEGGLALSQEGGHSVPRVVHAGGAATGAEIERALVAAVRSRAVSLMEGWFALDLVEARGSCAGVVALDPAGRVLEVRSTHVLLATGGAGQLYSVTTNPAEATADGLAMALRAGVAVADVEFMQFHPTALHHPAMPRPLLSEALRGHGALLRDDRGKRFVEELSPRDAVSRAMAARMAEDGVDHLWLDATGLECFEERFPTIASSLRSVGLDPSVDWLPIAPAAHYLSGGVVTDLDGASSLPGLWAAGEVACTGVHGANRLASNSLLEGMVYGARVVDAIASGRHGPSSTGAMGAVMSEKRDDADWVVPVVRIPSDATHPPREPRSKSHAVDSSRGTAGPDLDVGEGRARLQSAMTKGAGVAREAASLASVQAGVDELASRLGDIGEAGPDPAREELVNLVEVARRLVAAARLRTESRGAHTRLDYPETDEKLRCRLVSGS
jgi:L-aspartate oxidase